jgi:hypothetical protein
MRLAYVLFIAATLAATSAAWSQEIDWQKVDDASPSYQAAGGEVRAKLTRIVSAFDQSIRKIASLRKPTAG